LPHTFTHLAYALADAVTGEMIAVSTGGSLLHGRRTWRCCHAEGSGRAAGLAALSR
jgi:hypothetical protein